MDLLREVMKNVDKRGKLGIDIKNFPNSEMKPYFFCVHYNILLFLQNEELV